MTLQKDFLIPDIKFHKISTLRFIIGINLGLFYAFAFYSFLYMSREVFRIMSVTEHYDLWLLTDEEVNFYNLFFALLSTILGQSITFSFWLDRPRKFFSIYNHRKKAIVNDQHFLIWYFLSWFSKLAMVIGIMFGLAFYGGFFTLSFYPTHNYILIFIIIVLFLQTWVTIRRTFKRQSLKWLMITALCLFSLSYGISKINLINYKALNESILNNNVFYKYRLDLPASELSHFFRKVSLIEDIYLVEDKATKSPLLIVNNLKIKLQHLPDVLKSWQLERDENEVPMMTYRLYIHSQLKMSYVIKVKKILANNNVHRAGYVTCRPDIESKAKLYPTKVLSHIIPYYYSELFYTSKQEIDFSKYDHLIHLTQSESGNVSLNNEAVNYNSLKNKIRRFIESDSSYAIIFNINEQAEFSAYFSAYKKLRVIINELRNEYSEKIFNCTFDELTYADEEIIKQTIPVTIFELDNEFRVHLKMLDPINKE